METKIAAAAEQSANGDLKASTPAPSELIYRAGGHEIALTARPDRIAVGLGDATDAALAKLTAAGGPLEGLTFVRWLDHRGAVLEGQNASRLLDAELPASIQFAVPVFTNSDGGRDALVLDDVIVALNPKIDANEFFANDRFAGYRPLWGSTDQFVATLAASRGADAVRVANELSADPRVQWSEPNFFQDWQTYFTPNDPEYLNGDQWHLKNTGQGGITPGVDIRASQAWDLNPGGLPSHIISIVDDGVEAAHPDLNPWLNPGDSTANSTDDDNNGYVDDLNGWNFVSNNNNSSFTTNNDRHGTAVAGLAAAKGNNGANVAGVAFNEKVLSARIFENGPSTDDANIGSALYYAAGRNKSGIGSFANVDVINCSWGGGGYSNAIAQGFVYATTQARGGLGSVVAVASGNSNASFASVYQWPAISFPASLSPELPGLIAVGAANSGGTRSNYSQYGVGLDLVAPSGDLRGGYSNITTTDRVGSAGYSGSDVTNGFNGTSAATPIASGVAALVLSQASSKSVSLTAANAEALINNTTTILPGFSYDPATGLNLELGHGLINAFAAVDGIGKPELSVLSKTADLATGSMAAFGSAPIGGSVSQTFRIRNGGTSELTLSTLAVTGAAYSLDAGIGANTLKIGEATTFTVRFAPTAAGASCGSVSLTSNDADEGTFTLSFSGTGAAANVSGIAFEDWNGDGVRDANDPGRAGQAFYLDANGNSALDRASYTTAPNGKIPTADATGLASAILVSGQTASASGVTVKVNITHPHDRDLTATLTSPSGTMILLAADNGYEGDNFTNTFFSDSAALNVSQGIAPFTGSYQPAFGRLALLDGEIANGNWTLTVNDLEQHTIVVNKQVVNDPNDFGTLLNWTLEFNSEAVAVSDSHGLFAFLGTANGNYTGRAAADPGWTATAGSAGFPVTIANPSDSFSGFVFGSGKNNRAYLRVHDDQNADGLFTANEPGVSGRTLYRDANGNGQLDVATPAVFTNSTPVAIPDYNSAGIASTQTVSSLTGTVIGVTISLDATQTYDGDLKFVLESPAGTLVTLMNLRGGEGLNFTGTTFDDAALIPIGNILDDAAPFRGRYRPELPLAAVNGQTPNGVWTLHAYDLGPQDLGTLLDWTLAITTVAAEVSAVTDANGNATLDLPAGSNSVRLQPVAGAKFTNPPDGLLTLTAVGSPLFDRNFGIAEAVAPAVTGLTVNDGSLQRSMVFSVTVLFSEHVQLAGSPASAFGVTGPNGAVPFTASVDDSGGGTAVTLDFGGGSLPDGVYIASVNSAAIRDAAQNSLAATNPFEFTRLFGDLDGSRSVDPSDVIIFGGSFGTSSSTEGYVIGSDFDLSGSIDPSDVIPFGGRFGVTI